MNSMVPRGTLQIAWWVAPVFVAALFVLPNLLANPLAALWLRLPGLDKLVHFIAFVVLLLIINGAVCHASWPREERNRLALATGLTLAVAVLDEVQQAVLRIGRTAESGDLVADTAGILVGVVVVRSRQLGIKWAVPLILLLLVPVAVVTAKTHQDLKHYNLGMVYEREHDYQRAREEYQLALDSGFESAQLYNAIAWLDIEFLGADPILVEPYAARAYALDPRNPDILDTYGWVLVQAGRVQEGLPLLEKAKALKPTIYCIDLHLGVAYAKVGKNQLAEQYLRSQIALGTGDRFEEAARRALQAFETEDQEKKLFRQDKRRISAEPTS
ncbi:MAG: VanZ family protein [Nitrospira sp.]|nr:VanZ family protein [Nitrospira sp.]